MAITITPSPVNPRYLDPVTVTIAGATASTAYVLTLQRPSGFTTAVDIVTDGSGGAVYQHVPQEVEGTVTFTIRPKTESTGTTTAAATATIEQVG